MLLHPGFPRQILSSKHPQRSEGCAVGKVIRGYPWTVVK